MTLHWENFPWTRNFPGCETFQRKLHTGGNARVSIWNPPQPLEKKSLSYEICLLFTYSICIVLILWEVCMHFSVKEGRTNFCWGDFALGEFSMDKEFSRGWNFSEEIAYWGKCQSLYTKFLYLSCFIFTDSILRMEVLRVIVQGKFSPGLNCPEKISVGRGIFPRTWGQIFWRFWKTTRN